MNDRNCVPELPIPELPTLPETEEDGGNCNGCGDCTYCMGQRPTSNHIQIVKFQDGKGINVIQLPMPQVVTRETCYKIPNNDTVYSGTLYEGIDPRNGYQHWSYVVDHYDSCHLEYTITKCVCCLDTTQPITKRNDK